MQFPTHLTKNKNKTEYNITFVQGYKLGIKGSHYAKLQRDF